MVEYIDEYYLRVGHWAGRVIVRHNSMCTLRLNYVSRQRTDVDTQKEDIVLFAIAGRNSTTSLMMLSNVSNVRFLKFIVAYQCVRIYVHGFVV